MSSPPASAAAVPSTDPTHSDALYFPLPSLQPGQVLFRTTGAAEIHVGPSVVLTPSSERLFTIMVLCAMSPDHMIARSQLLEYVWPDMDVKSARHTLRQQLYRLRLLGVPLTSNRAAVVLDASCLVPSFSLGRTAELFDRDVLQGQEPFGQLFAGWRPENDVLHRWVEQQRDRYHMDVRRVLLPELHRLRDRAEWMECERWARTVLEFDPLNEDATLILAEAIAMQGSRVDARYMLDGYVRETGVSGTDLARHVEEARRRIGRATRVRFEHSATPTLIGRDAELQQLDALTLAAMQGETRVVHILGPTGIGKTELAYEATRRAVILGFTRCIVRVTRPIGEVPYGTLSRLVRDLLKLPGALGCRPESLDLLRQLTGESSPDDHVAVSRTRPASIAECLLELLAAITDEQPLVVLIDDVQYVDRDSRTQLEQLEAIAYKTNLLLLLTERADTGADGFGAHDTIRRRHLVLPLLSLPAAQLLAEAVTTPTGRRLLPHAAENIARTSNRTPLHIITLAKTRLTEGITAPQSVKLQEALTKQLRALGVPANTMMKCLAALGGRSTVLDLDLTLELPFGDRVAATTELLSSALISEDSDGMLRMHDEVRAAVSAMMTHTERAMVSRRTAEVLLARLETHFEPERCDLALSLAIAASDWVLLCRGCVRFAEPLAAEGWATESLRYLRAATTRATSVETRASLLNVQMVVAQRAAAWQTAVSAGENLRQIAGTARAHNDMDALSLIEASLRSELLLDGKRNANRAFRIACKSENPTHLRIRAARLAIGAASDLLDEPLAVACQSILNQLATDCDRYSDELLETTMQFHTIFGDLTEAVSIAVALCPKVEQGWANTESARYIGNSAYVLRVAGESRLATERFHAILEAPRSSMSPGRRAFAAWQLSLMAADKDEPVAAVHWNDVFRKTIVEELSEESDIAFLQHQLRIELLTTNDIADPTPVLQRFRREWETPSRASLYSLGLSLNSNVVLEDRLLRESLLDDALGLIERFGRLMGQDLLVLGAIRALEFARTDQRSKQLLRDYFGGTRRERSNPNFVLQRLPEPLREVATSSIAGRCRTTTTNSGRGTEA